jgi:hypothetical protein
MQTIETLNPPATTTPALPRPPQLSERVAWLSVFRSASGLKQVGLCHWVMGLLRSRRVSRATCDAMLERIRLEIVNQSDGSDTGACYLFRPIHPPFGYGAADRFSLENQIRRANLALQWSQEPRAIVRAETQGGEIYLTLHPDGPEPDASLWRYRVVRRVTDTDLNDTTALAMIREMSQESGLVLCPSPALRAHYNLPAEIN